MRLLIALLLMAILGASAAAATKAEVEAARKAFQKALKLQKQNRLAEAFTKFKQAADLEPGNFQYVTAREIARQQLIYKHLQAGNQAVLKEDRVRALGEFRAAAALDPSSNFALERLRDAMSEPLGPPGKSLQIVEQEDEIELRPNPGQQNFQFTGDTRALFEQVARSFGLTATFDENSNARRVKFKADGVDFVTAISLATRLARAMWVPLSDKQIFIAQDTAENHRQFDHMSLRTFYLPDVSTAQQMNEIVSVLRGLFDIRHLVPNAGKSLLTVRAPKPVLDIASTWLEQLGTGRPQLMLDVRAYQVNESLLRSLGLDVPRQFQIFNIPASALQIAQNPNLQDLINQLIASGGLNQANTQAISALLAQLQSQTTNPLLSQRFAVFGGGLTLFGVGIPPLTLNLSLDKSSITNLEHMTLRAADGTAATFRVGTRFPVLNGTFSPAINTPAINDLLTNQTFVAPFPSFSYEDLGMTLKATPQVHSGSMSSSSALESPNKRAAPPEITLALELEIRSLSSISLNGIPVISNRQFTGAVRLREGEPAVVAGMVSRSEQRSLSGIPGLGQLPVIRYATSSENKNVVEDEILFVITPYIVRSPDQVGSSELWLPAGM
jgi:general secretion pathway protein D